MAADFLRLSFYFHLYLSLSFSRVIGLRVSRDVAGDFSFAVRSSVSPPSSISYDVTSNAVVRPNAESDDVIENAAANATYPARRRRKAEVNGAADRPKPEMAWNRELAAETLQKLEQELDAARVNCSATSSGDVRSLGVELPVRVRARFSAEAASAVHAANVVSLLLQSPTEMTSHGDAFYFSFARAIVESAADWVKSATLVVNRPGQPTIALRASRITPSKSSLSDLIRVRDVGLTAWYSDLLKRGGGAKAGRCGLDSWTTRRGDVVNKSTVISELTDVVWSTPYVRCPVSARVNITIPIFSCDQQHNVITRCAGRNLL